MDNLSFTRAAKTELVNIDIKDTDGTVLKTISFNPYSGRGRKQFAEIMKKADEINKMLDNTEYDVDKVIVLVNGIDDVFADLDRVFGEGVTELITYGEIDENSIDSLKAFIDVVLPFYEKAAQEETVKTQPYKAPRNKK